MSVNPSVVALSEDVTVMDFLGSSRSNPQRTFRKNLCTPILELVISTLCIGFHGWKTSRSPSTSIIIIRIASRVRRTNSSAQLGFINSLSVLKEMARILSVRDLIEPGYLHSFNPCPFYSSTGGYIQKCHKYMNALMTYFAADGHSTPGDTTRIIDILSGDLEDAKTYDPSFSNVCIMKGVSSTSL